LPFRWRRRTVDDDHLEFLHVASRRRPAGGLADPVQVPVGESAARVRSGARRAALQHQFDHVAHGQRVPVARVIRLAPGRATGG